MKMKSLKQTISGIALIVGFVLHGQLSFASPEIVGEFVFPETSLPRGVAVDSETGNVYVADHANDEIYIFDGDLNLLGNNIPTDENPYRIAIDPRPETRRLFVGNFTSGTVEVFSLTSGQLICSLPAGPGPHPAFNMATEKLYIGVEGTNTLKVFGDQDSCTFLSELSLGTKPMSVAIDDLANRVYVAIHHEQRVSVIDGDNDSVVANIDLIPQGDPTDVAVNPNTHHVYVAYSQGNAVTEIDTGPLGLGPYEQTNLIVGDGPRYVQVDSDIDRAYVSGP